MGGLPRQRDRRTGSEVRFEPSSPPEVQRGAVVGAAKRCLIQKRARDGLESPCELTGQDALDSAGRVVAVVITDRPDGRSALPVHPRLQVHLQTLAPAVPPEQLPLAHCMFRLHGAPARSPRIGRCGPPRHTPSLQFREAHCRSNSQCAPTGSLARLGVASSMIRAPPSMRRCSIMPPVSSLTRLLRVPGSPGTRRCSMLLLLSRFTGLSSRCRVGNEPLPARPTGRDAPGRIGAARWRPSPAPGRAGSSRG